jgi:uncharacterized membrane protein
VEKSGVNTCRHFFYLYYKMMHTIPTSMMQNIARIILGLFMVFAATAHFTFRRSEFQAQVPVWLPLSKNLVVILSGVIEIALGVAMIHWTSEKIWVGCALAIFLDPDLPWKYRSIYGSHQRIWIEYRSGKTDPFILSAGFSSLGFMGDGGAGIFFLPGTIQ